MPDLPRAPAHASLLPTPPAPSPSDVFRWALLNRPQSGAPYLALDQAYRQYAAIADQPGSYLWRHYDRRLAPVADALRPGIRVLEVGSGYGVDLAWAGLSGAKVLGVEVKSPFADASQQLADDIGQAFGRPIDLTILRRNVMDLDEGAPFDLIYMKEALHHLEPRAGMVAKIARLLAPGGRLAILEPNAWNLALQWRLFRIRGFRTIVTKTDPASGETFIYGNERVLTGGSISRHFAAHGIAGRFEYHRIVPTPLVGRVPDALVSRVEPLMERLLPWLASIHCTWSGEKKAQAAR